MPTNRKRRSRKITRVSIHDIPKWQWDFILDGVTPPERLGFEGFCFSDPTPGVRGVTWPDLWERVKDHPITQEYRQNSGTPYAEQMVKYLERERQRYADD